MQQFVVPQFIDVEDKIFGPVTTRQFLILLSGGILVFIAFKLADFSLFIILLILIGGFSLILAFYKPNGQVFHYFLLNVFQTVKKPPMRIWRKFYDKNELNYLRKLGTEEVAEIEAKRVPAKREHIRDLALTVNTGGFYHPED